MIYIPAHISPTLCLGRTFDNKTLSACADLSSSNDKPPKSMNINKFSFKYQVVKSNKDINDLLDISGELSLQIKANLLKVEGAGQYIKENKVQEGRTNLLAVMKCTTLVETIEGSLKVRDDVSSGEFLHSLGTHYVRSVTYGVEMVASLTFKSSSQSSRNQIEGKAEGNLDVGGTNLGLKAALDKLSKECNDVTDISINYYATDLPERLPTTISGLLSLIENFPSRLKSINDGRGIPVQFELQPVNSVIPNVKAHIQQQTLASDIDDLESCFDDLRNTQALAEAYLEGKDDGDVVEFCSEVTELQQKFKEAIKTMNSVDGPDRIKMCTEAYKKARGGHNIKGKFTLEWKKILEIKAPFATIEAPVATIEAPFATIEAPVATIEAPVATIEAPFATIEAPVATVKLPSGDPLTIVLFGKTGNGKSATGNSIIGSECFEESPSGSAVTQCCNRSKRDDEREVTVIDTPGIMDTASVLAIGSAIGMVKSMTGHLNAEEKKLLQELASVFVMSPDGLDAIIITIKYGCRFLEEDAEALKILKTFFGTEAQPYMILILTYGDQAARDAKKKKRSIEDHLTWYISTLPDWVRQFLKDIGERRMLFDNSLDPTENPDECKRQVSKLLQIIDEVRKQRGPLIHRLTKASKEQLDKEIKKAMDERGITKQAEALRLKEEELKREIKEKDRSDEEKRELEKRLAELEKKRTVLEAIMKKVKEEITGKYFTIGAPSFLGGVLLTLILRGAKGGCYPGSAIIYDFNSRARRIESLQVGDKVLVITNNGIQSDTVITFIHRQPEIVEGFLQIVTKKEKILLITADHLLFVEVIGQPTAIPARDVKIGDTVYVRGSHGSEKDLVQSISTVYEKGAYAPVTLSGTILVNDVHTSCYFDVLSHEWSHRAMSIARALHYVSPSMVRRISAIGEKDGFPGWCRLAHTMLTLLD